MVSLGLGGGHLGHPYGVAVTPRSEAAADDDRSRSLLPEFVPDLGHQSDGFDGQVGEFLSV